MLDFQQQLDQFFQSNDKGYPRDPRRMAYAKLRKNTAGMDREQLEAFIDANLMIPFSQYKMALGNLIKFVHKYDEMNKLNEIEQFKKLAGILKEDEVGTGTDYDESSDSESDDTDAMDGINEAGSDDKEYYETTEDFLDHVFNILNDEMRAGYFSEKGLDKADTFLTKHGEKLAKSGKSAYDVADALMSKFNYTVSEDVDYESESNDTDAIGGINEAEGGFKFKVGDVVNSKVSKGNKLVVLMAFPNLEAAYKYDGESEPTSWERAILNNEIRPVSKDVANKPWYLTWTRETVGEDLITCDPEEYLSRTSGGGINEDIEDEYEKQLTAANQAVANGSQIANSDMYGKITPDKFINYFKGEGRDKKFIYYYMEPGEEVGAVPVTIEQAAGLIKSLISNIPVPKGLPAGYAWRLYAI